MRQVMKRALTTALASAITLAAAGCSEAPTAIPIDTPEPQFAKGGKGRPPPDDRSALTATIVGDYDPSQPPSGALAPRILGDGDLVYDGSYLDGAQDVVAHVWGSGSTWLDLRGSTLRTFWVDLRGAQVVRTPEFDWTADACGTDEFGAPTQPCESTQYFSTGVPADLVDGSGKAGFGVFWKADGYQYRLTYGKKCNNNLPIDDRDYVDVVELTDDQGVIGWEFTATTAQDAFLSRSGKTKGKEKIECLGNVKVPFTVRFMLQ